MGQSPSLQWTKKCAPGYSPDHYNPRLCRLNCAKRDTPIKPDYVPYAGAFLAVLMVGIANLVPYCSVRFPLMMCGARCTGPWLSSGWAPPAFGVGVQPTRQHRRETSNIKINTRVILGAWAVPKMTRKSRQLGLAVLRNPSSTWTFRPTVLNINAHSAPIYFGGFLDNCAGTSSTAFTLPHGCARRFPSPISASDMPSSTASSSASAIPQATTSNRGSPTADPSSSTAATTDQETPVLATDTPDSSSVASTPFYRNAYAIDPNPTSPNPIIFDTSAAPTPEADTSTVSYPPLRIVYTYESDTAMRNFLINNHGLASPEASQNALERDMDATSAATTPDADTSTVSYPLMRFVYAYENPLQNWLTYGSLSTPQNTLEARTELYGALCEDIANDRAEIVRLEEKLADVKAELEAVREARWYLTFMGES
ncbi:hypothetical protein BU23DRAFT_628388 [Bimuria novae-zelandiae CBS 107.79]|uniref:Uncharacterized protein n=1 Tax=Bimuria novae-zelandiae CBS 107.79 TaxID=1447943 RepID=A0A6A5VHJ4_9PLEO|nr:hypothetical protein BU23DRAFT_628388 [Bimuria novae-zelandiae CBS 107.79]